MANDDLLLHAEEISDSFETADLTRTWLDADPGHTDPATLKGNDLTAYQQWESATKAEWAQASRRVAQEYDRLSAIGFGTVTKKAADPTFMGNLDMGNRWSELRNLARPKDKNGDVYDVNALPDAWNAVRRNPRDLAGVLEAMRTAALPPPGPARDAYYKSDSTYKNFEGNVSDAKAAVTAWTRLVTATADPSPTELNAAVAKVEENLWWVRGSADLIAKSMARRTGVNIDQVHPPLTEGVLMYVAAVADEISNEYAARVAQPSWGLMFERISEIPSRGDVPAQGSPDWNNSSAQAQLNAPDKAVDFLANRLQQIQGLDAVTDAQAKALGAAMEADLGSLSKTWDAWRKQYNLVPRQDMNALKASTSDIAFRLERLRGAVSDALINDSELQFSALAPIDGLVALVQRQTEYATEKLG